MPRYKDRRLQWTDVLARFEARSHSDHSCKARGLIERLKDEGARFCDKDSEQLRRWQRYCSDLLNFLNSLDRRRNLEKQSLETAMREFIPEFEHSTERIYQMLFGAVADPENDEDVKQIVDRFNLVYRSSTYALLSAWIDDKHEDISLKIIIDRTTGKVREEGTWTEMQFPKKYRNSTKSF